MKWGTLKVLDFTYKLKANIIGGVQNEGKTICKENLRQMQSNQKKRQNKSYMRKSKA